MSGAEDQINLTSGSSIPTERYSDQPYIVKSDDGARLCVVTTGQGREGQSGQHVVTTRSVEPGAGMEPAEVKRLVGGRVCITGNISCAHPLPHGTPA